MTYATDDHTGARIATHRKLRHLTQEGLAQRAHIARSTLAKVEAGCVPASPVVVATVARVLRVDVAALTGQPYMTELQKDHLDGMIAPLAEALDMYDLGPDPAVTPRPTAKLLAETEQLMRLARQAKYTRIGVLLPPLLGELTTAFALSKSPDESRRLASALANTYRTAHEFAYRLGYTELGAVALERMGWAADWAQDPLLLAVRLYRRGLMALRRGNADAARKVLSRGHTLVEQADEASRDSVLAVSGELHLTAAVVAARAGDRSTADDNLAAAAENARSSGEVPQLYWLSFGPSDVARRRAEILVEFDELDRAVEADRGLRFPEGHSPMRMGRHHINMAGAYAQTGSTDLALQRLLQARHITPQQVRYNPLARETVTALVRRQRSVSTELASLASWVGM